MNHGAVGLSYLIARAFQGMSLIAIIGMTANFIAEIVSSSVKAPDVLIGTLSVVSLTRSNIQISILTLLQLLDLYCSPLLLLDGYSVHR